MYHFSAAFGTLNKTKTEKGISMSMGSVNSSPKKPPAASKLCTCTLASQSQSDKSVCDSTRATVAMSSVKSDPTTSVDSLVVEDVNDSGDQQIESASSVTTPSKCFTRPLSKCATTPFSLFSLKSTPTKVKSCKSHECGKSFNSVKSEGASKLTVTSKRPSTVSVTANKPATNNKSAIKVFAAENVRGCTLPTVVANPGLFYRRMLSLMQASSHQRLWYLAWLSCLKVGTLLT